MSGRDTEREQLPLHGDSLGTYLASVRKIKRMTLREVEEATGKEISNAYLSQLENNKISQPSPHILHALSKVYSLKYESLMEKAGYLTRSNANTDSADMRESVQHGRAATFAGEFLTPGEEDQLLKYLAFLRSSRGGGSGKSR